MAALDLSRFESNIVHLGDIETADITQEYDEFVENAIEVLKAVLPTALTTHKTDNRLSNIATAALFFVLHPATVNLQGILVGLGLDSDRVAADLEHRPRFRVNYDTGMLYSILTTLVSEINLHLSGPFIVHHGLFRYTMQAVLRCSGDARPITANTALSAAQINRLKEFAMLIGVSQKVAGKFASNPQFRSALGASSQQAMNAYHEFNRGIWARTIDQTAALDHEKDFPMLFDYVWQILMCVAYRFEVPLVPKLHSHKAITFPSRLHERLSAFAPLESMPEWCGTPAPPVVDTVVMAASEGVEFDISERVIADPRDSPEVDRVVVPEKVPQVVFPPVSDVWELARSISAEKKALLAERDLKCAEGSMFDARLLEGFDVRAAGVMFTQTDHIIWTILAAILSGSSTVFYQLMTEQHVLATDSTTAANLYKYLMEFVTNSPKFTSEVVTDMLTKGTGMHDTGAFLSVLDKFSEIQDFPMHFPLATRRMEALALYLNVYNASFPTNLSMYRPADDPSKPRKTYNLLADPTLALTLKMYKEERPELSSVVRAHLLVKLGIYAGIIKNN